ncbi:transposable element Tc3 transposase [Trichonephila clavipes]|nr:transposable element Tc3 transposase [Trichonephila clavipes]
MDDSAPCHRAVLIDDFLETENFQCMPLNVNSPDLNPNEHVWYMLGRQIAALSHPPSSVTELKRALQEAWNRLSPQLIHHLIAKRTLCHRIDVCYSLLKRHENDPFLKRIVTGGEKGHGAKKYEPAQTISKADILQKR